MLNTILHLIFPPKCIFCSSILQTPKEIDICDTCYSKIPFTDTTFSGCPDTADICYYDTAVCVCHYSGIIRTSLIKYKFGNKPGYYRTFAALLAKRMTNYRDFDIIISVPLHKSKLYTRGFNQSQLISQTLCKHLGLTECSNLLSRTKNTNSQSLLAKKGRYLNVSGAFSVTDASKIQGKSIILVDDILTTGSTLNECSKVLKQAGAERIVAGVIASGRV